MKLKTKQIEQIELDYEAHDIELEDFLISGIKDGGTERINLLEIDSDFYEVYGDVILTRKVGDKIRVKSWETLVEEFGLDRFGDIACERSIIRSERKKYCGKVFTITEVFPPIKLICKKESYSFNIDKYDGWYFIPKFADDCFEIDLETDDREKLIEKCIDIAKKMIDCKEEFIGVRLEILEYPDWEKLFRSTKATNKQLQKLSKKVFYGGPDFDYYMDYLIQK